MHRYDLRRRKPLSGSLRQLPGAAAALLGLLLAAGAASAQGCVPPEVTVTPMEQTVCAGQTATFIAAPTGTFPLTISWQVSTNGGMSYQDVVPADMGTTLSFPASLSEDGYIYRAFVVNGCGFQTGTATLHVQAIQPPQITSLSATPSSLWPPNNKMALVTVHIAATENCGSLVSKIIGVANNETGAADAQVVDATHVLLRATRLGNGHGRVYTITVETMNTVGGTAFDTVTVTVPHDQGH